jgi:hypothetical protein
MRTRLAIIFAAETRDMSRRDYYARGLLPHFRSQRDVLSI